MTFIFSIQTAIPNSNQERRIAPNLERMVYRFEIFDIVSSIGYFNWMIHSWTVFIVIISVVLSAHNRCD